MPVRSLHTIIPMYWIPPIYTANPKITVERHDGTIDDITDLVLDNFRIEDGVTDSIGVFEFKISNANESYTTAWTGMEIVRFYCDYAATPTTLRFRGRIEKPSKQSNYVVVTGRSEALFVQEKSVNKAYVDQDAGYIIKDLFDTYGDSRFDTLGINVSTGITLTLSFNCAFHEAIAAVCSASTYDCYVSCNLVVEFFAQNSRINTSEGLVHDMNLMSTGDFAPDLSFVKNEIRVKGGNIDGVQIVYTARDSNTTNLTLYGTRRLDVDDDGIVTFADAAEYANFLLAQYKDPPIVGEMSGLLLATIQPGEMIRCSDPQNGVPPGVYRVVHYKHENMVTIITINKETRKIGHVMKDIIQRQYKSSSSSGNPEDLDFSDVELFNSNIGEMIDTIISSGVLSVASGKTSGMWLSPVYQTADGSNVDELRISLIGDDLPGVTIEASANGGQNFTIVERDELKAMINTGSQIQIRLTLTHTASQVDSLKIQYSTL